MGLHSKTLIPLSNLTDVINSSLTEENKNSFLTRFRKRLNCQIVANFTIKRQPSNKTVPCGSKSVIPGPTAIYNYFSMYGDEDKTS